MEKGRGNMTSVRKRIAGRLTAFSFVLTPMPNRTITASALQNRFVIPPGDPNYEVKSTWTAKEDVELLGLMPHMHVRGKDFKYTVVYPDGHDEVVLNVPKYDFNWQLEYEFARPLVLPKGTRFSGHVTSASASGRLKGRAQIGLTLDSFEHDGRRYEVRTTSVDRVSAAHKKRNGILIGGGTGLGAALGAIAGGPKGALIGAGAGAAAGTAGAAATGKREVGIPTETILRFTLRKSVEI